MPQIISQSEIVDHLRLREFAARCLQQAGVSAADASLVADTLVESNLRGIDSHGVARLLHYLNRINHGSISPTPEIKYHRLSSALGRIDGGHGLGQVVLDRACKEVVTLARESGAGWIAIENSSHCGALAYFGQELAKENMISFLFTHSDSMVAPEGAKNPFCGTNPFCITIPGEAESTLCLDMATSIVPWNTISNAAMEGVEIPENWGVNEEGLPTTDPREVRAVRPFGGYKGANLGLLVDVLCSFLLATPYGPDIPAMYGDPAKQRHLGGLVGAIDVSKFRSGDAFRTSITQLVQRWNQQPTLSPETTILFPGQPELETHAQRLKDGIPIGVKLLDLLKAHAAETGIPWTLTEA